MLPKTPYCCGTGVAGASTAVIGTLVLLLGRKLRHNPSADANTDLSPKNSLAAIADVIRA